MLRGEIWLLNLDPAVGAEIRKTRPVIIVNDNAVGLLPLKVIVPVTEWKDLYAVAPWMVRLDPAPENGLSKPSACRCLPGALCGPATVRTTDWKGFGPSPSRHRTGLGDSSENPILDSCQAGESKSRIPGNSKRNKWVMNGSPIRARCQFSQSPMDHGRLKIGRVSLV